MNKLLLFLLLNCFLLTNISIGVFVQNPAIIANAATLEGPVTNNDSDGTNFYSKDELLVDEAGLLTSSEKERLASRLKEFSDNYNIDAVIVTAENTGSKTNREFADDFYDYSGYGRGENHDGMVLLINIDTREWYISTSGKMINYLTDNNIQKIGETIKNSLSKGEYFIAFDKYIDMSEEYIIEAEKGTPFDVSQPHKSSEDQLKLIIILLLCSLVIAFISVGIMCLTMNTAVKQSSAKQYQQKLNLTNSRDIYLYSHTTSRRIQTSSNRTSSSTHTSSSGRNHGGGGGSF